MKNVIVVRDYPQECGNPSLRFVDCSTGEVLKEVDIYSYINGYWEAVFHDKSVGNQEKFYLEGGVNPTKLRRIAKEPFKEPWLCVIERKSHMLELVNTFYEHSQDWSGENVGSISKSEDVSPKTWIRPDNTVFYEMSACKYLRTDHHSRKLGTTEYSYDTHIFEVYLAPVTFSEKPIYHKDADPLFEDLAEQGIDPSGISAEDREQRDDRWLAHYIAKQFNWKILNIV